MAGITPIHHREFEKFLLKIGCQFVRQRGDHRIYWRDGLKRPVVVPTYKALPIFIIKNNLRIVDISTEEYLRTLQAL